MLAEKKSANQCPDDSSIIIRNFLSTIRNVFVFENEVKLRVELSFRIELHVKKYMNIKIAKMFMKFSCMNMSVVHHFIMNIHEIR